MTDHQSRPNLDDTTSAVAGRQRRPLTTWQKIGVGGLVLVVFLGFVWVRALDRSHNLADAQAAEPPPSPGLQMQQAPAAAVSKPMAAEPLPAPTTTPVAAYGGQSEVTPADSPILAFSGASISVPSAPSPAPATDGQVSATPAALISRPTSLSARLQPTVLAATKAELLPHPDMMLTMGTVIPCTLQTAITSELAGYVKCVIPQDIRSTTGNVVLLDKGTTVVGEIQQGLVQGQTRVFVLWDRAETPDHAVVQLNSPGTDELGRAGMPGGINDHFWQRFGSAIMLSFIQGGLQAGANLASAGNSSNGVYFNSFQENGQQLSNTALQNSINIPPTLEKNQGDDVAIFVAKDVDFSDVYSLRVNGHAE
jgi:type IV secretion system protein VirB10